MTTRTRLYPSLTKYSISDLRQMVRLNADFPELRDASSVEIERRNALVLEKARKRLAKRQAEAEASLAGLRARGMLCTRCGAVLSAVTFTCSRGEKYCS